VACSVQHPVTYKVMYKVTCEVLALKHTLPTIDFAYYAVTSIKDNYEKLQEEIYPAEDWEKRSGVKFKGDKAVLIHFTHTSNRSSNKGLKIKGQMILPTNRVNLLGIIFNDKLRFKEHLARATARGLRAALTLGRLRTLSPITARQLFTSAVVSVIDYGSVIWGGAVDGRLKTLRKDIHCVNNSSERRQERVSSDHPRTVVMSFRCVLGKSRRSNRKRPLQGLQKYKQSPGP
jgi:hypothetical protein